MRSDLSRDRKDPLLAIEALTELTEPLIAFGHVAPTRGRGGPANDARDRLDQVFVRTHESRGQAIQLIDQAL